MPPPLHQQSSTMRLTSSLSSASRGRRPRWLGFGVPARGSKWVVEDAVVEDIAEEFRRGVLVCIWGGGVIRPVGMPGYMCWEIPSDSLEG